MIEVVINQNFGQIGIQQYPASIRVSSPPPSLQVDTRAAEMVAKKQWPAVIIDMTKTRESMGYKPIVKLEQDIAKKAMAKADNGVRREVREGDQMGRIENHSNPIPQMAKEDAWSETSYNVGLMPTVPPDIKGIGRLEIDCKMGKVSTKAEISKPQISASPGSVDIYVKEKPSIEVKATGQWIDLLT